MLKSPYRFPYCLKDYFSPLHYYYYGKHLYQRMRHGVSDYDMFNFDSYLSDVLRYALPNFKNVNSEFVIFHLPEDAHIFYADSKQDEAEEKAAMARWDAMIDEIIEGLNRTDDLWGWEREDFDKLQQSFVLLGENLPALWT